MLLNISTVSGAERHLSPPSPVQYLHASVGKAGVAGLPRVVPGLIITHLLLMKLRCGHLWFHCCLRAVPGFGLFPQNPCLCISFLPLFLPQPSVSPCVSLPPLLCWQAARSYGRRRGNVWHFLWGSACHAGRVSLRGWGGS